MRVVMLSKACIVGTYQRKLEEIARFPDVELTVLTPPSWQDSRGRQPLERAFTTGYELRAIPIRFNGRFHLHYYPTLLAELRQHKPDLLHIDEEPYNLATRHAMGLARRLHIPALFFTWQNLHRTYPIPFRWWERYNYRHAAYAIAGNHAAAEVLRAKGYRSPLRIIPQFGVDPQLFTPPASPRPDRPFTIGYAGGLIPEKGIETLLQACAHLRGDWQLHILGSGAHEQALRRLAARLGLDERVQWLGKWPSTRMPDFYRTLDAFVLPSRTRPNWMEQFGRVLIEAMACGVPTLGSNSGEIPHVLGDAGLIFPEGDASTLGTHLQNLLQDAALRKTWGDRGRQRVLAHYTQQQIATATVDVYRAILSSSSN